jgi:hypothetical protein
MNWNTLLDWAAGRCVKDSGKVTLWTWAFSEWNTQVLVACAFVVAATIIDWLE